MRVRFLFDLAAWENPAVRYTIEVVAPLLDLPWRAVAPGAAREGDAAVVFVGAPGSAPSDAAAVVAVRGWEAWRAASLDLGHFEEVPLPCPGGRIAPSADPRELPEPWLRAIAFMLVRDEEYGARRDPWGCFSGTFSRLHELGVLEQPLVNQLVARLSHRIAAWCERRGTSAEPVPRWRGGARFAVALTHDVDDVTLHSMRNAWRLLRQASGIRSYAFRKGVDTALHSLARRGPDPYWNFDRWVAEESRRGFRSCFYFCPPSPRSRHEYDALYTMDDTLRFEGRHFTVRALMRTLADRGFEIGLHGAYRSHRDSGELKREKGQIEEALGRAVTGVRQHFLRFEPTDTWGAQAFAGFDYDTTLGYNEVIGFRAGIAAPFHPWESDGRVPSKLLELPLTAMDGALFRTMKLDAAGAIAKVREHLERVEAVSGLAVLLWHPNAAAEEHFPGWWSCYIAALDHIATRSAWVATPAEIAAWWREREAQLATE